MEVILMRRIRDGLSRTVTIYEHRGDRCRMLGTSKNAFCVYSVFLKLGKDHVGRAVFSQRADDTGLHAETRGGDRFVHRLTADV